MSLKKPKKQYEELPPNLIRESIRHSKHTILETIHTVENQNTVGSFDNDEEEKTNDLYMEFVPAKTTKTPSKADEIIQKQKEENTKLQQKVLAA